MTRSHRYWLAATVVVGLLVGGAAAAYLDRSGRERTERDVELATSYTLAFADRAAVYLVRGRPEDLSLLTSTAGTLLFGNVVLYVQVVVEGAIAVEVRAPAGEGLDLPVLAEAPTLQSRLQTLADGTPYVDVIKTLFPLNKPDGTPLQGYVRLGTSLAQLRAELRSERLVVLGIALGTWGLVLAGLGLGVRLATARRAPSPTPSAPSPGPAAEDIRQVGPLALDPLRKTVTVRGRAVELSPKEFDLLQLLCSQPGKVFSSEEILQAVWEESSFATAQDVKQYIYFLRRKLEADPKRPELILTVRGFGYKVAEAETA